MTGVPLSVGTNAISFVASNAAAADIVATDSPTNSVYGEGWSSGDGGGAGWGVWTLAAGANAGHFIATQTSNTNLDIAATAWGLWANSGDSASATRFLAGPLRIGEQMRLLFENHWVDSGRSIGIAWRNSLGDYLVEFLFLGGGTNYLINDATATRPTGIPFTDRGLELVFEWTGTNTYRLTAGEYSMTGTAAPRIDSEVRQFHAWNYSAGSGANYDFFFSDLEVTAVRAASNVSATATIVRLPPVQWVWEVRSDWGTAHPATGVYTNDKGTVLTNFVTKFDTRGTTQYQCVGWTLANHNAIAGTDTQVVFTLTNDTILTWHWSTNYWLQTAAGEHGVVQGESGWVPQGVETQVAAVADIYFHFTNWVGDLAGTQQYDNPLILRRDRPYTVTAIFGADVTTLGTPHWWLASYGWTNEFDQVELEDADGDNLATWQEWISATDPTNAADVFRAQAGAVSADGYVVEWIGRSNRTYWLHVYTNVMASPEASIGPFDGPLSIYTDRAYNALSPVYYRVTVER